MMVNLASKPNIMSNSITDTVMITLFLCLVKKFITIIYCLFYTFITTNTIYYLHPHPGAQQAASKGFSA